MEKQTAHRRKRTGCVGCRVRRKKCDERQPVCSMCAKKGSDCVWPNNWREPQTVSSFALDSSSESPTSSLKDGIGRERPSPVSEPAAGRDAQAETALSKRDAMMAGLSPESLAGASPQDITCGTRRPSRFSPGLSHIPFLMDTGLGSDNKDFQLLFQHFIGWTLPSLSVDNVDTQLYASTLVPLIMTDPLVLRSILAMSSLQYMLSNPKSGHALKLANACYSRALSAMRGRVALSASGAQVDRPECLAAASLMLALTEATRGDSCTTHLDFTSHVLQTMSPSARTSIDQKLYRNLIRVCIYLRIDSFFEEPPASAPAAPISPKLVRQNDMPTLCALLWEAEKRATASQLSKECGLFQTPFISGLLTIPHLARLQATPDSEVDRDSRVAQLSAIEMQIMSWEPALPKTGLRVRQVWTLWRLAMLLLLYQSPVDGAFWKPSRRDDCFQSFMNELKLVPKGHESFGVMLWPMLMAGSCAHSSEDRETIQDLLTQACEPLAARLPAVVANLLKSIWDSSPVNAQSAAQNRSSRSLAIDPRLTSSVSSSDTPMTNG